MEKKPPAWKLEINAGFGLIIGAVFPAAFALVGFSSHVQYRDSARKQVEDLREAKASHGTLRVTSGKAEGIGKGMTGDDPTLAGARYPLTSVSYLGALEEHYVANRSTGSRSGWLRSFWKVVPFWIVDGAERFLVAPKTYGYAGDLEQCAGGEKDGVRFRGFGPGDTVSVIGTLGSRDGASGFFDDVTIWCGTSDEWLATEESRAAEWARPLTYVGFAGVIVLVGVGVGRLLRGYGWKKDDAAFRAAMRRK